MNQGKIERKKERKKNQKKERKKEKSKERKKERKEQGGEYDWKKNKILLPYQSTKALANARLYDDWSTSNFVGQEIPLIRYNFFWESQKQNLIADIDSLQNVDVNQLPYNIL